VVLSPGCGSHHLLIISVRKNRGLSEKTALLISPVYHAMKLTDPSLKSHSMVGSIGTENMMQYELWYFGISIITSDDGIRSTFTAFKYKAVLMHSCQNNIVPEVSFSSQILPDNYFLTTIK
jgi:hypothetical protein